MAITALAVMPSCEDDLNSKELLAYLSAPVLKTAMTQTYSSTGEITTAGIKRFDINAHLSRPTSVHTQIKLIVDTSFVAEYNAKNKTSFKAMDPASVSFMNGGTPEMQAEEYICGDTVLVDPSKLKAQTTYLLPIAMESISSKDKGIVMSTNRNVVFITISIGILSNIDLSSDIPTGTAIDRSGWKITASDFSDEALYPATKMIDNDPATYWHGAVQTLSTITVDMGSVQPVKALQLLSMSGAGTLYLENITKAAVETSTDGVVWDNYGDSGSLSTPGNTTAPAVTNYIKFIYAKPCRYYKIITKANRYSYKGSGIPELNALK